MTHAARTRLLLVAALACLLVGCPRRQPRHPHVILISADALRADHLSVHGYPRNTSPNVDALAAAAIHFTDVVTVLPKTGPSFTTMFTGLHPRRHGVDRNGGKIPPGVPVVAELLRSAGYRTAAFVSNPVLMERAGYSRGFEVYRLLDDVAAVNREFAAWARRDWKEPTFVWLHYIDPHGPYTPAEPFAAMFRDDGIAHADDRTAALDYRPIPGFPSSRILGAVPRYQRLGDENRVALYVSQYDGEVRQMDEAFGEVAKLLRDAGLYDASAMIFTSDHGESLGENDYYFEHGWYAYDSSVRIPLVVKTPGQTSGRRSAEQASTLDFLPTILDLAGVAQPAGLPGRSLLTSSETPRPVVVENAAGYPHHYVGLRRPGWKYLLEVRSRKGPPAPVPGREELYDLASDPGERRNLAAAQTERLREMRAELLALLASDAFQPKGPNAGDAPVDSHTRERLKSLGYVD